jgi:hypothetical protein
MGLTEEAVEDWVCDDCRETVEISDSHLYKVTLVVAIPNYTSDMGAVQQATAVDLIMDFLSNDPEITVLDVSEKRLEVKEIEE